MRDFETFRTVVCRELFTHPVITDNPYTAWFSRGGADEKQVAELLVQFSVFSNHFLILQVKRMVNAGTLEGERCARNILMNECGVGLDPRTGSVEGRTFSTGNAHLNWLRQAGAALGLEAMQLGRWEAGSRATHQFLEGLDKTYGSHDGMVGAGASFAIETWAASGLGAGSELEAGNFWRQLIRGLEIFNGGREEKGLKPVPLGFFKYHAEIESGHGANVWRELEQTCGHASFDARRFLDGRRKALDAIAVFWHGLDAHRREGRDMLAGSASELNHIELFPNSLMGFNAY